MKTTDDACLPVFTEAELARARYLVSPQKPPANTGSEPVWPLVMADVECIGNIDRMLLADMCARDEFGRDKYKVPLTHDNTRDHLKDVYEETLDSCAYYKAAILDKANARYAGKLGYLYNRARMAAHELRLMIAHRDGELPR